MESSSQPEQVTIAGEIPAVIWPGIGQPPRSAVIYLPGGLESKWDVDTYTRQHLPAAGISIVSIDMYMHGDRLDDCLFLAHADGHGHPGMVEELALTWLIRQLSPDVAPQAAIT